MTCPGCGAAMHVAPGKDYLICDYCGATHFPDPNPDGVRVFGEPTGYPCPRCAVFLVQASVARTQVVYCNKCHGLLFQMDGFMAVVEDLRSRHEHTETVGQQPDWHDLDRHTMCPRCRQQMDTHVYGGGGSVIMDSCENCLANWLDYGELQRIVRAGDATQFISLDADPPDEMAQERY